MSKYKSEERPLRCQMSSDRWQIFDIRRQKTGVRNLKPKPKFGAVEMNPGKNSLSSALCLLISLLLLACNPDRPNFEPSYSGAPPGEDLDQYLDTDAVFEGLDQVKGKRQQVDSLLTLADKLKNYDDDVALVYADTAYSMALEKNWDLSRGIASYYIALLKGRREKYGEGIEDAMVDAKIGSQIFKDAGDYKWQVKTENLIGFFYERKNDLLAAKMYLNSANQIIDEGFLSSSDSLILKGELLHDLANLYASGDSLQLAQKYYKESHQLYQLSANDGALARLQFDWAQMYYNQGKYLESEELIQSGLNYAREFNDINALIMGHHKLGVLYNRKYRDLKDKQYFDESMRSYRNCFQFQKEDLYFLHNQIGQNYQRAASTVDSEEQAYAYVDSAIVSYRRAMDGARVEGVLHIMKKMGRNISQLCKYRTRVLGKDCADILKTSAADLLNMNYAAITDTIGNTLSAANKRNRLFQKQQLEAKNRQRISIQWIITGSSLLLIGLFFVLVLQGQQQKRLKAKMEALRAQINPHFISNSLNAIESLVNMDKKEAATKYLIHFSRLTRKVLNSSRDGKVSLTEEIKTLEHFLELEQLRFRDKLRYLIDVDEDINPNIVEMPAMILQPYIENAIWHGIKPKQGPGLVKVQVEQDGKFLVCTIKDNGIGRTKAAEIKAASVLQQNSVGMKINQERLNVVGRAKGAKVEIIDLYDEDGNASGTQVIIRLPYKEITKT